MARAGPPPSVPRGSARLVLDALATATLVVGSTAFARGGRSGLLRGSATPSREGDRLVLEVDGRWRGGGTCLSVREATRWTRLGERSLRVEHLRRGRDEPVELGVLEPGSSGAWRSARAHVCGEDRYRVRLDVLGAAVQVRWRIQGPGKRGWVRRAYRPATAGPVRPSCGPAVDSSSLGASRKR